MRMILPATTALAAILLAGAFTSGAAAAECGTVTIASMNWQSAEVLSNVDKIILSQGYGWPCRKFFRLTRC